MKVSDIIIDDVKILSIMDTLKKDNQELVINAGFGYCGYGSKLLSIELDRLGIRNNILTGTYFRETEIATSCKLFVYDLIKKFNDGKDIHGTIKRDFIKRGNHLPNRVGHGVVLVDNVIYDITSGQFNLPNRYSVLLFHKIWNKIKVVDIEIDKDEDFYISLVKNV